MVFGGDVDLFRFGVWSHPASSIHGKHLMAVALSNDNIYGVQSSFFTKSAVFRISLKIEVFDIKGNPKKPISLSHKDIHDSISYGNGRLLA